MPSHDALDAQGLAFYRNALRILDDSKVPYLVGGAYASHRYTGIYRNTRDFDVFVKPEHGPLVLDMFRRSGYRTEMTFRHWLGKIHHRGHYVDVIFSSGNGICRVDDEWFTHATHADVLDHSVLLCPAEEMIWSKAYIMERERFDGADIAHLIRARAEHMDWERLMRRFEPHPRILLVHLLLFGFIYPGERDKIPSRVMQKLLGSLDVTPPVDGSGSLCLGTLISRSQYVPDLEWGYRDCRLPPYGNLTPEEVEVWTDAASEEIDPPHAVDDPGPEPS